jgi:hypothetical protein
MKKTLGVMGLLLCWAGMFTLPAATRNRNDNTNNQNYAYTQTYAQGHNDAYVSNARRDNDRDWDRDSHRVRYESRRRNSHESDFRYRSSWR